VAKGGIPQGVWVQFATPQDYQSREHDLLQAIADSDGNDDVVVFLKDTKNFKVLPVNRRVKADDKLKYKLSAVYGEENIKIRL